MDKVEACQVLSEHLARYRARSHSQLSALVESKHVDALTAKLRSHIRVVGTVCDGGWRCVFPLTETFIMKPDWSIVG